MKAVRHRVCGFCGVPFASPAAVHRVYCGDLCAAKARVVQHLKRNPRRVATPRKKYGSQLEYELAHIEQVRVGRRPKPPTPREARPYLGPPRVLVNTHLSGSIALQMLGAVVRR